MLLQTIRNFEQRATGYSLRLLILMIVILPAQLNAQWVSVSAQSNPSIKHVRPAASENCPVSAHSCCRRLLLKLSLADYQVGNLSGLLNGLEQNLASNRVVLSDAIRQIAWSGELDRDTSVMGLLMRISLTAKELVKIQLSIGSLRSELLIANHNRTTATNAVGAVVKCTGIPGQTIQSTR